MIDPTGSPFPTSPELATAEVVYIDRHLAAFVPGPWLAAHGAEDFTQVDGDPPRHRDYRRFGLDWYAYHCQALRHHRAELEQLGAWDECRRRINAIWSWALPRFGKEALNRASRRAVPSRYPLPAAIRNGRAVA